MTAPRDPHLVKDKVIEGQQSHSGPEHGQAAPRRGHGHGHGVMMIACCIPMLAIAGILVATGAASPFFLVIAVGCTLMMAIMMRGTGRSGSDDRS